LPSFNLSKHGHHNYDVAYYDMCVNQAMGVFIIASSRNLYFKECLLV